MISIFMRNYYYVENKRSLAIPFWHMFLKKRISIIFKVVFVYVCSKNMLKKKKLKSL